MAERRRSPSGAAEPALFVRGFALDRLIPPNPILELAGSLSLPFLFRWSSASLTAPSARGLAPSEVVTPTARWGARAPTRAGGYCPFFPAHTRAWRPRTSQQEPGERRRGWASSAETRQEKVRACHQRSSGNGTGMSQKGTSPGHPSCHRVVLNVAVPTAPRAASGDLGRRCWNRRFLSSTNASTERLCEPSQGVSVKELNSSSFPATK